MNSSPALLPPRQLLTEISKQQFRAAYYFYGEDEYRIVEAEKFLIRSFLPPEQIGTSARKLNARKTPIAELLAELAALPMLGEKLVVAVSDPQQYKTADLDRIFRMLVPADPNRLVIFSTPPARQPRWDSAFLRQVKAAVATVQFDRLDESESHATLVNKLKKAGLRAEPEAIELLVSLVAGRRGAIDQEVDKLRDYIDGTSVSAEDVRQIGAGYQTFLAFDLAEHLLQGERTVALKQVNFMLSHGATAAMLVRFLYDDLLILYKLQHHEQLPGNIAWKAKKIRPHIGRIKPERVEQALVSLGLLNRALRHSPANPELLLQQFIVELSSDLKSRRVA